MRAHVDTSHAWLVVGLLFLFMLINFADKAVLGLSAVPIMRELGLTHTQFGLVGTSFFAFFSLSAVCVGFLVNRVPTGWVLMAMAFIWSMCQLPMLLTIGLPMLIANRVALGLGEGAAYPVVLHAAYKWFPNDRRPLPTSLIELGSSVGIGVVAPAIVYLIVAYSWHVAFGVLGLLSLLWCVVWLAIGREGPLVGANVEVGGTPRVSYRRLLTSRTFVGCVTVGFVAYWQITLAIVWLPAYLTQHVGYTATQVGWIMTLASLSQIVLLPILAAGSQKLKRQGVSSRLTRGCIPAAAALMAGLLTIVLPLMPGKILPIICTMLAFSVSDLIFILGPVAIAEVTPIQQRGAMLGMNNALATLAGPLAPVITGVIVDLAGGSAAGFRTAFIVAGGLVTAGALAGLWLIDPAADVRAMGGDISMKVPHQDLHQQA